MLSLDLLRGLDVLLMLFVNEVAGVAGAPAFLLHKPASADGMTITDVVFPAFLFITGMAIPFALGTRLERGQPRSLVWRHVATRVVALLVLGVLMVNADEAAEVGMLSAPLWNALMTVAAVLAWQAPGGLGGERWRGRLRLGGAALLVVLAFLYRAESGTGWFQMRPHWWGILGLIGWAYLVAAGAYLLAGERLGVHVGLIALLNCLYFADEAGHVAWMAALAPVVQVGRALGSHAALTVSGMVLGLMLRRHRGRGAPDSRFVTPALAYAATLAAAGLLLHSLNTLHPAFAISKIRATPAWCLLSGAYTAAAWALLFLLVDVKGWRRWPKGVRAAGENALVAYLLAPFFLSLFALSAPLFGGANPYYALDAGSTVVGLIRSAAFAWVVVLLTDALRAAGVRMHL